MGKYTKVKLILLGDTYTGKSSILSMYKNNYYSENITATIGVDFVKSTIKKTELIIAFISGIQVVKKNLIV